MFLRYRLVADGAHLYHPLRADGTRPRWWFQTLDEWEVGFVLWIRTAVQQPNAAGGVLQGTRVADEGGGVEGGRLPFSQGVVPVKVRHTLSLEQKRSWYTKGNKRSGRCFIEYSAWSGPKRISAI